MHAVSHKFTYSWSHSHDSGHGVLSADERLLITTNLKDAIDIYSMPPTQHIRALLQPVRQNFPLLVSSALNGNLTLVGNDDGAPRLYDQRVGTVHQTLPHGNGTNFPAQPVACIHPIFAVGTLVQVVTVRPFPIFGIIAEIANARLTRRMATAFWPLDHLMLTQT